MSYNDDNYGPQGGRGRQDDYDNDRRGQQDNYGNERRGEGYGHSTQTPYGGGGYGGGSDDFSGAAQHASRHAGDSGDSGMFSNVLGSLMGQQHHLQNQDVDEEDAVRQHQKFYGGGGGDSQASSSNIGTAAAMQALKMFGQGGSSGSKNEFIGMAMGQAAQLFEQQSANGNTVSSKSRNLCG